MVMMGTLPRSTAIDDVVNVIFIELPSILPDSVGEADGWQKRKDNRVIVVGLKGAFPGACSYH